MRLTGNVTVCWAQCPSDVHMVYEQPAAVSILQTTHRLSSSYEAHPDDNTNLVVGAESSRCLSF